MDPLFLLALGTAGYGPRGILVMSVLGINSSCDLVSGQRFQATRSSYHIDHK